MLNPKRRERVWCDLVCQTKLLNCSAVPFRFMCAAAKQLWLHDQRLAVTLNDQPSLAPHIVAGGT